MKLSVAKRDGFNIVVNWMTFNAPISSCSTDNEKID